MAWQSSTWDSMRKLHMHAAPEYHQWLMHEKKHTQDAYNPHKANMQPTVWLHHVSVCAVLAGPGCAALPAAQMQTGLRPCSKLPSSPSLYKYIYAHIFSSLQRDSHADMRPTLANPIWKITFITCWHFNKTSYRICGPCPEVELQPECERSIRRSRAALTFHSGYRY